MKKILFKIFGPFILLIFGDLLVLDRWLWLRKYLKKTQNNEKILDIGCGNGGFSINLSLLGYKVVGISNQEENVNNAIEIAKYFDVKNVSFISADVFKIAEMFSDQFDIIVCTEVVEHILDDNKLFQVIFNLLKPGGQLYLTTPNYYYEAISREDLGPFSKVQDGGHVRKGYTRSMLKELSKKNDLRIEKFDFCSGFLSQKITKLYRFILFGTRSKIITSLIILPFRFISVIFDPFIYMIFRYPYFSICLVCCKDRYKE